MQICGLLLLRSHGRCFVAMDDLAVGSAHCHVLVCVAKLKLFAFSPKAVSFLFGPAHRYCVNEFMDAADVD